MTEVDRQGTKSKIVAHEKTKRAAKKLMVYCNSGHEAVKGYPVRDGNETIIAFIMD